LLLLLTAIVFGFMAVEARRAARNERTQRTLGGVEPEHDVYALMRVAYPGAFAAMLVEGALRGTPPRPLIITGAGVFVLAKALKWWAMLTLDRFWTFRVIVIPGAPRIRKGPYRALRHPNYLGVIGELAGVALITGALVAAVFSIPVFGALILKRIAIEERALAGGPATQRDV